MRKYIFFLITVFILSMLSCSKETLPLENSIVMGNRDAKHKLVVFFDPDCPICSSFHKEMNRVISQRSDIAFFIKLFPLSNIHPSA
jgi:thiol:disulfide interchange protein DsbC